MTFHRCLSIQKRIVELMDGRYAYRLRQPGELFYIGESPIFSCLTRALGS